MLFGKAEPMKVELSLVGDFNSDYSTITKKSLDVAIKMSNAIGEIEKLKSEAKEIMGQFEQLKKPYNKILSQATDLDVDINSILTDRPNLTRDVKSMQDVIKMI